jgi:hypothetical protein
MKRFAMKTFLDNTVKEHNISNPFDTLFYTSVAEPEPHHLVGAGAVKRCGSGSEHGIKNG